MNEKIQGLQVKVCREDNYQNDNWRCSTSLLGAKHLWVLVMNTS